MALTRRVRIAREGVPVSGTVVDTVYAFDQAVIPAGAVVRGRVTRVAPVPKLRRALAMANADFSPTHEYTVNFDTIVLSDGTLLPISTAVLPGTGQVIHLASAASSDTGTNKQSQAGKLAARQTQEIRDRFHRVLAQIKSPDRWNWAKDYLLSQSPYRRQYLPKGTRFNADILVPLDFGSATRRPDQLGSIGTEIAADSTLHARLGAEVSSATAHRDSPIEAIVTEPVFNANHELVIAADSRLLGKVTHARAAGKLHHNGELRVVFEKVVTPEGIAQAVQGTLKGADVSRDANMKMDEEGGTRVTDNKSRYLTTGLSVLIAVAAGRGDPDAPGGAGSVNPGAGALAGASGFKLVGIALSLTVHSRAFSSVLGGYGAATSVYTHFLSRGKDVVLPKDTAVEIGIGDRRPAAAVAQRGGSMQRH